MKPLPKNAESPLPVGVRRSKKPLLKLPKNNFLALSSWQRNLSPQKGCEQDSEETWFEEKWREAGDLPIPIPFHLLAISRILFAVSHNPTRHDRRRCSKVKKHKDWYILTITMITIKFKTVTVLTKQKLTSWTYQSNFPGKAWTSYKQTRCAARRLELSLQLHLLFSSSKLY